MVDILQNTFPHAFSVWLYFQFSHKSVPIDPSGNESMMVQFTDAHMRHQGSLCQAGWHTETINIRV